MQHAQKKTKRWLLAGTLAAAAVLWWGRTLVWLAAKQLFLGMLAALAALPVMKRLEKRFLSGTAAALSIAALNAALVAALIWLLPALMQQFRQLTSLLPGLWKAVGDWSARVQAWLAQHGITALDTQAQSALLSRVQDALGAMIPSVVSRLRGMAGGAAQWLLAPVFGFYFLRDRRALSRRLIMLLPVGWRQPCVRILREMRRETAGYLRGQLMLSVIVGALTAVGLLFCGVPAWLALGVAMGVLELIPYVGPVIGGVLVALFSLPQGIWRTLWALGVVVAVQQVEGSALAPRLISQTTRLHPAAVILCILLGGSAAGMAGILLSVPLVLCVRAAVRVALLYIPPQRG